MRACLDEGLGQEGIVGGTVGTPSSAVDEDVHRRVRRLGTIDVELLDLGRPIGEALGQPQHCARFLAVGDAALADLVTIGGIDDLVIGVVELVLVHVEPHPRPFPARVLRRCRGACRDCHAAGSGRRDRTL